MKPPNGTSMRLGGALGPRLRRAALRRGPLAAPAVVKVVRKRLRTSHCTFVTDGPNGPAARVIQPVGPDDDLTVYVGTGKQTRKLAEVAQTGRAVLAYATSTTGVVLHCDAEISAQASVRRSVFRAAWHAYWPGGPDEDDFVVVVCRPHTIEVWDARAGIHPAPFGLKSARLVRGATGEFELADAAG